MRVRVFVGFFVGCGRRGKVVPGRLRGAQGGAEAVEAFEIVSEGDQIPFQTYFREAPQGETPEPEHFLDDPEARLDGLLAQLVESATSGGGSAVTHPFGKRSVGARRGWIGALLKLGDGAAVRFALQGGEHREAGGLAGRITFGGGDGGRTDQTAVD